MKMEATYGQGKALREKVINRLESEKMSKAELAEAIGYSRATVSQYLNGKYRSDATDIEEKLLGFLSGFERQEEQKKDEAEKKQRLRKRECFESADYINTIGVCSACQENAGLGIIVGRSGYGKTHALKQYANLKRVFYIECNETMNCKDVVRKIEREIGMPKIYGSIDEHLDQIIDFFSINKGYLLLVDEADKLITKYTQKKIEILRYIADRCSVGIVIAGEPSLESSLKAYDARFANRMDFYYKLRGLSREEVRRYFEGYDIDEEAMDELIARATNGQSGCFRLLDRTLNNVMRVMKGSDDTRVTMNVIRQASGMMML